MRTVILGPRPPEFEALLERRRARGQDHRDEVWNGEYHLAPPVPALHRYADARLAVLLDAPARRAGLVQTGAFNLGSPGDYRVPGRGVHRSLPATDYAASAAMVVEIVAPDDETWHKLGFYAAHEVGELLIADPAARSVSWLSLAGGSYARAGASDLLGLTAAGLAAQIGWPPAT